jgi:hypothetical protein
MSKLLSSVSTGLITLSSALYILDFLGVRSLSLPNFPISIGSPLQILAIIGVFVFPAWIAYQMMRSTNLRIKLGISPQALEGEIFGEKENRFLVGGTICFKARYRGNLKNGYFTTKIRAQELKTILDTGREYEWLVDYNTNVGNRKGNLNGLGSGWPRKSHRSTWGHKIPFMYPPGKYTVTLMVFDDTSPDDPLDTIPLTFTVLDEELHQLRGWTKEGKEIPAPRSMFVKKPRKRSWLGTLR